METPGATRILQKDNVTTTLGNSHNIHSCFQLCNSCRLRGLISTTAFLCVGLAELDFQLDMHPPLGMWKIFVENSAGKHTKEFQVDEFGKNFSAD